MGIMAPTTETTTGERNSRASSPPPRKPAEHKKGEKTETPKNAGQHKRARLLRLVKVIAGLLMGAAVVAQGFLVSWACEEYGLKLSVCGKLTKNAIYAYTAVSFAVVSTLATL